MAKYDSPIAKLHGSSNAGKAPHWPRECSVLDCDGAPVIAIAIVEDDAGSSYLHSGLFSTYSGGTGLRIKENGFSFVSMGRR